MSPELRKWSSAEPIFSLPHRFLQGSSMGLLRWLLGWWRPRPLTRDVSRLEDSPDKVDETQEVIDQSGGPLKEGHHRRALRDGRLLPKKKRDFWGRKKRVFAREEAGRLFAGTLRTRNRQLRDLLADEEQLARYGLPLWKSEEDLAGALNLTVKQLRSLATHREMSKVCHYVTFAIPRRSGGQRLIMAPKRRLKAVQRALLPLLIDRLPVSEHAHGFRRGRSVRTGAEVHLNKGVLLTLDLRDFFPTVSFGRVRGLLISLGYGYPVAATLAALMTESVRQPVEVDGVVYHVPVGPRHCVQGAPTSPGLCNCITRKLDHRLAALGRSFGFAYTRYADDLTFSGEDAGRVPALRALATRIVEEEGFKVNAKKTRVARKGARQVVTGVTVNEVLGLSRRERRRLRALLHQLSRQREQGQVDQARLAEAQGKLAYLAMLNPGQAEALRRQFPEGGKKSGA